jgi:hypothetical protein
MIFEDEKTQLSTYPPATPATLATQDDDKLDQSRESRKSRKGALSNSHFCEDDESQDLFNYLMDSITTGGAYSKLWPNIRSYCLKELPLRCFQQLDKTYKVQQ